MRLSIIAFLLLSYAFDIVAQAIRLDKEVELMPMNVYAARNPRVDSKGLECGVLMVHSTIPELKFVGNVEGDISYESGIYYVYLRANTTRLDIVDQTGHKLQIRMPKIQSKHTYEATLYKSTERGTIVCASDPSGAVVTLISGKDRIELGRTPIKNLEVLEGIYDLEILKSGYERRVIRNIKVNPNKSTKLRTVKLKKI
ncbi:MAG: PEGA domain-containing protein [Muribaculaceae bacterium]|nr:PEGA domain-containing protein [Muribaculaceae bacterium]